MRTLEFSDFELDLETMKLSRSGARVALGKRTCDALIFLIQNNGRFVSRQELHRTIWGSAKISPSTIPMCISEIRKALTDDPKSPRFVESLKRHGYRFVGQVKFRSDSEAETEFAFVGRRPALDSLNQAVRSTLADLRGRMITIVGEAGSGKTRLISEFIQQTSGRTDVIIARAISSDSESPYSIWSSALRAAVLRNPENKKLLIASDRIASIIPELSQSGSLNSTSGHYDQNSFHVEWCSAFKLLVSQRPLILILEDIHHADIDSFLLLERISAEILSAPIVIVASMRPPSSSRQHASAAARLLGGANSTLLSLAPFRLQEIECFIDPFAPSRHELAEQILHQTSGNAFYVTYVARLLRQGALHNPSGSTTKLIERDAKEIVSRQLNDLPEWCKSVLDVAAVGGVVFSPLVIAQTLGIATGEVLERLEPSICAGIVHFDGAQYSFRHAILRDSIYCAISHKLRMQLHERVAEILGRFDVPRAAPVAVFDHLYRAFPLTSSERVCRAGFSAATEAASRFAHNEARRIWSAMQRLAESDPNALASARCDILIGLAKATLYSGDRIGSRRLLLLAASTARSANLADRLARCGLDMAPDYLSIEVGTYDPELVFILKESLALLPDDSKSLRSQVLSRLSQALGWSHENRGLQESLAIEAESLACTSGDPVAISSALAAMADASSGPDLTDQRIERVLKLQEAALNQSDRYGFLVQQTRLIAALLEKGDVRRLRIENDRYREVADETGLPQYRWYPVSTDSMLACLAGDFNLADEHARRYAQIAGPDADANFQQTFACQYVLREIERDRTKDVVSMVEEFSLRHRMVYSWSAATAWVQWDCGRFASARETLRQFSESDILKLYKEPGGTIGLAALAETASYLGDRSQVKFLYNLIAPISCRFATAGYGVAYFGSLARYSSLLATALRRSREAIYHATTALREEVRLGAPTWRILAQIDLARAVRGRLDIGLVNQPEISISENLARARVGRVYRSLFES